MPISKPLTLLLIVAFLLRSVSGFSEESRFTPSRLVLGLHHGEKFQEETRNMTDAFREQLSRGSGSNVLSKARSEDILRQFQTQPGVLNGEKELIKEAKDHYLEFEMKQARAAAEKALALVVKRSEQTGDARNLLEAHMILGLVSLAESQKDEALSHFKAAVFIQPDKVYTEREYSFRVLDLLQTAKREILQSGTGDIEVKTDTAEIYVDGFYRGQSPLTIKGLIKGTHYVRATQTGGAEAFSKVEVAGNETKTVSLKLASSSSPKSTGAFSGLQTSEEKNSTPDLRRKMAQLASLADVQQVIVVGFNPEKEFREVSVMTYDRDTQKEYTLQVNVANPENFKPAVANLSSKIAAQEKIAAASVSQKTAPDPYGTYHKPKEQSAPKKSLFKKPLFWLAVALVAGGGAAGGMIAGGSGSSGSPAGSVGGTPNGGVNVNAPNP